MPKCVLVVPAYNEEARIAICLESLLEASLPAGFGWREWFVLDDRSTDGTTAIVREWTRWNKDAPPLSVLTSPVRRGKALNLNMPHEQLIEASRVDDVVVVCDADVVPGPGAIAALLSPFVESPPVEVAWGVPLPDHRGFGRLGSAFQMMLVAELAKADGPHAVRAEGRLFAYRVGALADFRWNAGWIVDDTQLADYVAARGVKGRTALEAVILTTPAKSYLDFYRQTCRSSASMARARALGSAPERSGQTSRTSLVLRTALADPLGASAYLVARLVSSIRDRLWPIHFDDAWEPARSTKDIHGVQRGATPSVWDVLRPRAFISRLAVSVRAMRAFENWPVVLGKSFLTYVGGPRRDLIVRTRTGLTLRCPNNPLDRGPIFEVLMDDVYRLERLDAVDPAEPFTILDIGAHIGTFALDAARRFPKCRVVCYEPNPRITPYLRQNIRDNNFDDRISVEQFAVGAEPGRARLFDTGPTSTILPGLRPQTATPPREVEVVAFDEVMARLGGEADVVKLDCEGSEYSIVLETPGGTWRGVRQILLEYEEGVTGRSSRALRRRLESLGFEVRWHTRPESDVGMAYLARSGIGGSARGDV
jgi:FkbM family methyltransferase